MELNDSKIQANARQDWKTQNMLDAFKIVGENKNIDSKQVALALKNYSGSLKSRLSLEKKVESYLEDGLNIYFRLISNLKEGEARYLTKLVKLIGDDQRALMELYKFTKEIESQAKNATKETEIHG